jgi:CrcB protein
MKKYLYIGAFGFCGAILRYVIKSASFGSITANFPINTLITNVTGAFLIALIFSLTAQKINISEELKLGLTTGFLGAYTTFSTLCKDTISLIESAKYSYAVIYVLLSVVLGILAIILAQYIIEKSAASYTNEKKTIS